VLITLLSPIGRRPAIRLRQLADDTIEIPRDVAAAMLRRRTHATTPAPLRSDTSSEAIPAAAPPRPRTRRGTRAGRPDRPALRAITGHSAPPRPPDAPAPPAPAAPSAPSADLAAAAEAPPAALPAASLPEPPRVLSRESFHEPEQAGYRFAGWQTSGRVYLAALNDSGEFAVRLERDGRQVTLATVDVLEEPPRA
jgi:hypothetical protein